MDCRTAVVSSSAELDGELSPAESADLAAHLASCDACARRRQVLEQTWRAVVRLSPAPVSPRFDAGVRSRLRRRGLTRWALAAAAVLVAILVPRVLHRPVSMSPSAGAPTPRVARAAVDPEVGLDCGLPGARTCVSDAAVVVLAQPQVSFTTSH